MPLEEVLDSTCPCPTLRAVLDKEATEDNEAVEAKAEVEDDMADFLESLDDVDKLLSLTGICCLISCLSIDLVSLVALIKCRLAKDSFFKLPPKRNEKRYFKQNANGNVIIVNFQSRDFY